MVQYLLIGVFVIAILAVLLYLGSRLQMRGWLKELEYHLYQTYLKRNTEKQNDKE